MRRRWHVRVCHRSYGQVAVVIITTKRRATFYQDGITVAELLLSRDDAEEQLAAARAKALSLVRSIEYMERGPLLSQAEVA